MENTELSVIETAPKTEVEEIVQPKKIIRRAAPKEDAAEKSVLQVKSNIQELERKQREHDMRPVTGTFKNFQSPALLTVFSCKKYKEEPIRTYRLRDGQTETVPFYVAEMLRQKCYYKRNKRFKGTDGVDSVTLGEKVKLMDFFPHTEFIPGTEAENSLVQVTTRR